MRHGLMSRVGRSRLLDVRKLRWFNPGVRTSDVFELLREGRPMTRAELAEVHRAGALHVAARVDVLMRLGLVAPYGDGTSTGGRPPSLLAVNTAARLVAGIDLGATHARAAIADLSGSSSPRSAPTWTSPRARARARLGRRHDRASCSAEQDRTGPSWRRSASACQAPWSTRPAGRSTRRSCPAGTASTCPAHVRRSYDVPVLIDNDVNIMALGEQRTQLPDVEDLVLIKVRPASARASSPAGCCSAAPRAPPATSGTSAVGAPADDLCRCGNTRVRRGGRGRPGAAARAAGAGRGRRVGADVADWCGRGPDRDPGGARGRPRHRRRRGHDRELHQPVRRRGRRDRWPRPGST